MKEKIYSPTGKKVLHALHVLVSMALVVCVAIEIALLTSSEGSMDALLKEKSYMETNMSKSGLTNQKNYILRFMKERDFFETDGVYDSQKLINTFAYAETEPVPNTVKEGLTYRLEDLYRWSRLYDGSFNSYRHGTDEFYSGQERDGYYNEYSDTYYEFGDNYAESYASDSSDINTAVEETSLTELYAPQGYASIEEFATKNKCSVESCYAVMGEILGRFYSDVEDYSSSMEAFDRKNTNIRYYGQNSATDKVYTNMTKQEQNDLLQSEDTITSGSKNNYTVQVTLDPNLPVKDSFYHNAQNYQKYAKCFLPAAWIGGISLLLWIITLVLITISAGHGKEPGEDGQTLLLPIDHMKTELAFALYVTGGVLLGTLLFLAFGSFVASTDMILLFLGAFVGFLFSALFLMAYTSLVRRIKRHTLYENSFLSMLVRWVKKTYTSSKERYRIVLLFLGYLFVEYLLCSWFNSFGLLLVIVLNIVVLGLLLRDATEREKLVEHAAIIAGGDLEHKIDLNTIHGSNLDVAESINNISSGLAEAVDASVKNERMKSDLITNVSHDIKTPLTSIINYVDLLKREKLDNPKATEYIQVLEQKSQRLKQLTDDLVEASKISSGNITLDMVSMNFNELLSQALGEFKEKFDSKGLQSIVNQPEQPVVIMGDGRRMWRILENLFNNTFKYAMPNTRVYIELYTTASDMYFSIKNISESQLNINADELTERFIRGDISRSTEGSGLGLSIAKNLTERQDGDFSIYLDGDLFKVTLHFRLLT